MTSIPPDAHEWVSFDDENVQRTWMFDVTFLESNWTCIFGHGCQGVLTGPTPELVQGCCSYGAHFTDDADRERVELAATRLTDDQWQFKKQGSRGTTRVKRSGEIVTRLVKDACIFLNRPDFHRGPGCALHVLAMDSGESYIPLKPDVCWQLPLHRDDEVAESGHVVTRIGQWDRRDWGDGGFDFHWWCTESPDAFVGAARVIDSMRNELIAMAGEDVYERLLAYVSHRAELPTRTRLAHPVLRRRR
ncbi:MAG: hypothetical protein KGJ92_01770 [Actinomycetales bacterium]|nr:hypothetical protein [Actinomycetales bacterium]